MANNGSNVVVALSMAALAYSVWKMTAAPASSSPAPVMLRRRATCSPAARKHYADMQTAPWDNGGSWDGEGNYLPAPGGIVDPSYADGMSYGDGFTAGEAPIMVTPGCMCVPGKRDYASMRRRGVNRARGLGDCACPPGMVSVSSGALDVATPMPAPVDNSQLTAPPIVSIDPTTGAPIISNTGWSIDPTTGLPIATAGDATATPIVNPALGLTTPIPVDDGTGSTQIATTIPVDSSGWQLPTIYPTPPPADNASIVSPDLGDQCLDCVPINTGGPGQGASATVAQLLQTNPGGGGLANLQAQ